MTEPVNKDEKNERRDTHHAESEDRPATTQEIKRELWIMIASIQNAPTETDLAIYESTLFDEVISETPSLRVLRDACRKLRRDSEFLPSIKKCSTHWRIASPIMPPFRLNQHPISAVRKDTC